MIIIMWIVLEVDYILYFNLNCEIVFQEQDSEENNLALIFQQEPTVFNNIFLQ